MSDGTLDRPTFETIEAYVLDRMSAPERTAFEQRMAKDPELRAEVELEMENIRAVELGGMERMLKGIAAEEHGGSTNGTDWSRFLKYAAVIAVFAGAAAWWTMRAPVNERLFAENFSADPGLPVTMGTTTSAAFTDAMVHYKEGHYAQAVDGWKGLLAKDPQNDTLLYYTGAALLAENKAQHAIEHLLPVADRAGSAFHAQARWYLFLAYVRAGDRAAAQAVDLSADPSRSERARSILNAWPQ